ncbi:hypothetical protein P7K49_003017, partial [Saguinus oedipus]
INGLVTPKDLQHECFSSGGERLYARGLSSHSSRDECSRGTGDTGRAQQEAPMNICSCHLVGSAPSAFSGAILQGSSLNPPQPHPDSGYCKVILSSPSPRDHLSDGNSQIRTCSSGLSGAPCHKADTPQAGVPDAPK